MIIPISLYKKKIKDNFFHFFERIIFNLVPREFRKKHPSLLSELLYNDEIKDCYEEFRPELIKSLVFKSFFDIRKYAIRKALENDKEEIYAFLEFGVDQGDSANYFSSYLKKLTVFDAFLGLREDWIGQATASGLVGKTNTNLNRKIPKLNKNIILVEGWVQDTLKDYLEKNNTKINFVHMDLDTYESSKFTLETIKPHLCKNAIIIFDQMINFSGWRQGEYKALKEIFKANEYNFKAFNVVGKQVVIQIN